jgi:hypothetical protein
MKAGIIERAFELARSGEFQTLEEVKRRLGREGYASVSSHLGGKQTRSQLSNMIADAKRPGPDHSAPPDSTPG